MLLSARPSSDCKTGLFGFEGRDGVDWSVRAVEGDGPTDLSPRASAGRRFAPPVGLSLAGRREVLDHHAVRSVADDRSAPGGLLSLPAPSHEGAFSWSFPTSVLQRKTKAILMQSSRRSSRPKRRSSNFSPRIRLATRGCPDVSHHRPMLSNETRNGFSANSCRSSSSRISSE